MARGESGHVLSRDVHTARAEILTAAQAVILRFGLAKTTMDDIAKEAGVSRPTVYRHFQARTDLVAALIDWRARIVRAGAQRFLQEQVAVREPFADVVIAGLIHIVAAGRRDPIVATVLNPGSQQGESWLETLDLAASLTAELWEPFFDEAKKKGEMRRDLESSELYVWLTLVQFSLFNRMEFVDPSDPIHARMLRTFVLPALVAPGNAQFVHDDRPPPYNRRPRNSAAGNEVGICMPRRLDIPDSASR